MNQRLVEIGTTNLNEFSEFIEAVSIGWCPQLELTQIVCGRVEASIWDLSSLQGFQEDLVELEDHLMVGFIPENLNVNQSDSVDQEMKNNPLWNGGTNERRVNQRSGQKKNSTDTLLPWGNSERTRLSENTNELAFQSRKGQSKILGSNFPTRQEDYKEEKITKANEVETSSPEDLLTPARDQFSTLGKLSNLGDFNLDEENLNSDDITSDGFSGTSLSKQNNPIPPIKKEKSTSRIANNFQETGSTMNWNTSHFEGPNSNSVGPSVNRLQQPEETLSDTYEMLLTELTEKLNREYKRFYGE